LNENSGKRAFVILFGAAGQRLRTFTNIPGISFKNRKLVCFQSNRVKHSGYASLTGLKRFYLFV
jgi:hypothetical protein